MEMEHLEVGIRDLKARLSEFLDRAESGQIIRVTHRGRPKAILGPVPGRVRLDRGIAEGWITRANRDGATQARRRFRARRSVREILAEDRGE